MIPLLLVDSVLVAIRYCASPDMAELVVALPLSIRMILTSALPGASHLRQWNQPASALTLETKVINLIAIYRPPDSNVLEFCNELTNLLESKINSSGKLILLRDFNIAVNKPSEAEPATFLDMLNSFNLIIRVDKPTHWLSNTLDLIIHDAN